MSTLILLQSHRLDATTLDGFRRLRADCAGACEVRLLLDVTPRARSPAPELSELPPAELFTVDELSRRYDLSTVHGPRPGIHGGNALVPVIDLAARRDFDHLWVIEYDVRFTGCWRTLFEAFGASDADLLTTTVHRYASNPRWAWFDSLRHPARRIPRERRVRAFLPVYRLTRAAVALMREAYRDGWHGHYEVLLPTLALEAGLVVEDLGGDGEFVRAGNRNRFYTNNPRAPSLAPGTLVNRPVRPTHARCQPGLLYHPVKGR